VAIGEKLRRIYWVLERNLAPGVQYAQNSYEESLFTSVPPGCSWLDLGCGHSLLPEWRASEEQRLTQRPRILVGLDPELGALRNHRGISLRVCGDGARLPFADASFDLVTANMVVEHLAEPASQFREIARVLKPGGVFLFHTPNGTGYPTLLARALPDSMRAAAAELLEGRAAGEDRFETFYRANTPSDIARIAKSADFGVDRIDLIRSGAMFPTIIPLAALELLFLRALASPRLSWLRPNLIATLRKQPPSAVARQG
jgi:SAM-dependent methyltransferase